ncbi:TPA: hypothetical protein U2J78_004969 [Serratia marcescens]|nr:hypothetical protein [Serratia marcescens]
MKRLTIRNIPEDIYAEFEKQAAENERSTESHARYAIIRMSQSKTELSGADMYQKEFSDRINTLLSLINRIPSASNTPPALLAELLGEKNPLSVMNWFSGHETPDFKQMDQLVLYTGCNPKWLKFGVGRPFTFRTMKRINREGSGYENALTLLKPDNSGNPVEKIHIMRMDNDVGNIYILRKFKNSINTDLFHTNLHLSEAIGNSGFHDLCDFIDTLQHLYLFYIKNDVFVKSYDLTENSFKYYFEERNCHPLEMIKHCTRESVWWEDIWRQKILEERNAEDNGYFWKGDKKLIDQILSELKNKNKLIDPDLVDHKTYIIPENKSLNDI